MKPAKSIPCPTCGSTGFDTSVLGSERCSFCDGTEGGNAPTEKDIQEAKRDARPIGGRVTIEVK